MSCNSSLKEGDLATSCGPSCRRTAARRPLLFLLPAVVVPGILLAGLAAPLPGQTRVESEAAGPLLRAADVFALAARSGQLFDAVRDTSQLKNGKVLAFENNRYFVYMLGSLSASPRLTRRLILLKPSTFVVDDRVQVSGSKRPARWRLQSGVPPEIKGRRVCIARPGGELLCETLLPAEATLGSARQEDAGVQRAGYRVEVASPDDRAEVRYLHLLHVRGGDDKSPTARAELTHKNGQFNLTIAAAGRVFRLSLPPPSEAAGAIAVSKGGGEVLLENRLLPSGVLPHGPQGNRLLEGWDSAYRRDRRPGWDTRRPASELSKVVEGGSVPAGRAVVLGCGSGTNAVYLARKGFEVTGIDVAPTALNQAQQQAEKAGVKVRWLLADVLAVPELKPFDFIFDRGCYHGVRRHDAAGYAKTVRRLSRGGTFCLILAGNANEARHYGPPRVKEAEIRADFSAEFDFRWLRETRFDTMVPGGKGPLAWSILLRRKE